MLDASSLCLPTPLWKMNDQRFWLASVLSLRRNIHPFLFPSKLPLAEKVQVMHLIERSLRDDKTLGGLRCLEANRARPWEKDFLIENFLLTESIHQAHWGEAFLFDPDLSVLLLVNLYDHFLLKVAHTGHSLQEGLSRLLALESQMGKTLVFSFSNEFGFMSSDPRVCGTGLLAQAFLILPGIVLSQQLGQILKAKPFKGMTCRMLVGGIIVLENRCALGVSEEQILAQLEAAVNHLIVMEMSTHKTAAAEGNLNLCDKIARTLGLVQHALHLTTQEALEAIGIFKLGLNMGWIEGISQRELNALIFSVRKAHMLASHKTNQTLEQGRALLLRNAVKDLSLRF
ncbi:hypothetical protein [Candidatus Similichlamydia laticola]|uniref:Putative ATP:guanido phosphotransferase YacI n=1 Tax=Candidatus Similichlamydia laticola TaxID=2170265 RepID=A0A369KHI5_9BACT|nr:hypothetical protein [Candidatus Similichlamydia laticola]RDB31263.1 putative ATP:guanido phosphotransferase YacI [Candidatus Similichlamydia laticola]